MKFYQSHKQVHAKPMTRGDYNHYRGWQIPEDENPADDGYLVIYNRDTPDHYESWSPKKQFDEGYTEVPELWPNPEGFDFGAALDFLKEGLKLARKGWNGKGMFLYHVPENCYPAQTPVAKHSFGDMVPYGAYIAMKTTDKQVVPWLASQTDMLADDWMIVE